MWENSNGIHRKKKLISLSVLEKFMNSNFRIIILKILLHGAQPIQANFGENWLCHLGRQILKQAHDIFFIFIFSILIFFRYETIVFFALRFSLLIIFCLDGVYDLVAKTATQYLSNTSNPKYKFRTLSCSNSKKAYHSRFNTVLNNGRSPFWFGL